MLPTILGLAVVLLGLGAVEARGEEPLTREDYVTQAERICKSGKERTEPLLKGLGANIKHGRLGPAGRALIRSAGAFKNQWRRLTAIPRPSDDAAVLSEWLGQTKTEFLLMARAGRLMLKKRRNRVIGLLARYAHAGNRANDTVLGFGFDSCLFRLSKLPRPPKR